MTIINNISKIPKANKGRFSIRYVKGRCGLWELGKNWILATDKEREQHQRVADKCFGKVLIAGLGLGVIVEQLSEKDNVTHIAVVEKAPEVIELVWKYLGVNCKAEVICNDIYDYLKDTERKFDCAYIDIWMDKPEESEISKLNRLAQRTMPNKDIFYWNGPKN